MDSDSVSDPDPYFLSKILRFDNIFFSLATKVSRLVPVQAGPVIKWPPESGPRFKMKFMIMDLRILIQEYYLQIRNTGYGNLKKGNTQTICLSMISHFISDPKITR